MLQLDAASSVEQPEGSARGRDRGNGPVEELDENSGGWMSDSARSAISATSLRIWFFVCSSRPGSMVSSGMVGPGFERQSPNHRVANRRALARRCSVHSEDRSARAHAGTTGNGTSSRRTFLRIFFSVKGTPGLQAISVSLGVRWILRNGPCESQ